jgi:cytochrome c biogenesis protein CcmG, thiol:disulfide interchange protein DsbE
MAPLSIRARTVVAFSFVVALTSACGGGQKHAQSPSSESKDGASGPAEVGKAAPPLSIQTLNGKGPVSLESLSGKIAIVDFWATWCGPCKKSFPKLEELAKQNAGKVTVVGISVDDSKDGVADWAKAQGASFPIGWDDGHAIAKKWKVEKMPTTYILDGTGTVRFVHEAYHDEEGELIGRELALLSSEPAASKSKNEVAKNDSAAPAPTPSDEAKAEPAPEAAVPAKPRKTAGSKGKPVPGRKGPKKKKG